MKHVCLDDDPDLPKSYHTIIRDYMYIKLTQELFNYDFLSNLASEARLIVAGLTFNEKLSPVRSTSLSGNH